MHRNILKSMQNQALRGNAALGQKMTVYQPVLVPATDQMHMQMKNNLPSPSLDINK